MTKTLLAISLATYVLAVSGGPVVSAQKKRPAKATTTSIKEVPHKAPDVAAPNECLQVFREFFRYLQKSEPSIVSDGQAQKRWLTQELRKSLAQKVASFKDKSDDPDFPGNGTFVGSWDYPSTYSLVASRRYGKRAVIDVLYKWGPGTNYPGDERTSSFIFLDEDGSWKLDDVYTFRGAFVQAESLSQYLREK